VITVLPGVTSNALNSLQFGLTIHLSSNDLLKYVLKIRISYIKTNAIDNNVK